MLCTVMMKVKDEVCSGVVDDRECVLISTALSRREIEGSRAVCFCRRKPLTAV